MHKTRYNALCLSLQMSPVGSLLIKAGGYSANPSLPDMQFVRTQQAGNGETVYIPGSSLKGVVRGFVEKVLRTLDDHNSWRWACPTFSDESQSCARQLEKTEKSTAVYQRSCGACRLFGHTRLRGRVAFSDLLPTSAITTETRYGVAISRLSHAVAQGPFEMEVVVSGTFKGQLVLENYELWQVGVLATALEAMNQGLLKVGFGKNRGFGQVQVAVQEAKVEELAPLKDTIQLRGVGDFIGEEERRNYGLATPYTLNGLPQPQQSEAFGFYWQRTYDSAGWQVITHQTIQALQ